MPTPMLSSAPHQATQYDRALALMQYQVELLWLIFGAFLLAETVLLAAIGSMMEAERSQKSRR